MFEKVNPFHPDKVADRIAGAIVDLAYKKNQNPKIAVEVLIGHELCTVIIESSEHFAWREVADIAHRITGDHDLTVVVRSEQQDPHLAANQAAAVRCGDNGIFHGCPLNPEVVELTLAAKAITEQYPYDGKYIINAGHLILCQSNAKTTDLQRLYPDAVINPLGEWTGGTNVDTGATNRKLGSDMGDAVTGGGLHGKDLSKADVSANIWCHVHAQRLKHPVSAYCAIGEEVLHVLEHGPLGKSDIIASYEVPYSIVVDEARQFINTIGGFERFAEWGLIR